MNIKAVDLNEAMKLAAALCKAIDQPLVLCDALAMAAHGYQRETSGVDIAIAARLTIVEVEARRLGLTVAARHSFGGLTLKASGARIDVLTLEREVDTLVPAAVGAAFEHGTFFGQEALVIPLGYLISMKLVASRKKDLADIVELIKARMEAGAWQDDERWEVAKIVRYQLGWYGARQVEKLAAEALEEIGRGG